MADRIEVIKIANGPLTVSYRQVDGEWRATALQFDLVGTGKTKQGAFEQLRELVNDYLTFILSVKGEVAFYNPASREEWEVADQEKFDVLVVMARVKSTSAIARERCVKLEDVRPMRKHVREFELAPAC